MEANKSIIKTIMMGIALGGMLNVSAQPPPLRGHEERWGRRLPARMEWCHRCGGRGEVKRNWLGILKKCPDCQGYGYYMMRNPPPPPPPPVAKPMPHPKPQPRPNVQPKRAPMHQPRPGVNQGRAPMPQQRPGVGQKPQQPRPTQSQSRPQQHRPQQQRPQGHGPNNRAPGRR